MFLFVSSLQVVNDLVFSGSSDQSVHAHNIHVSTWCTVFLIDKHKLSVFFVSNLHLCLWISRQENWWGSTRVIVMPSLWWPYWERWWSPRAWINWSVCTSSRYKWHIYKYYKDLSRNVTAMYSQNYEKKVQFRNIKVIFMAIKHILPPFL